MLRQESCTESTVEGQLPRFAEGQAFTGVLVRGFFIQVAILGIYSE